jgi:cyclophilin family peptidyl-prolyl cis-trans isomerase
MNPRFLYATVLSLGTLLAACGGGGGGTSEPVTPPATATVSAATAAAPAYGQRMLITINGSSLDAALISVTSPGCSSITRSTTAPNVSTATTAYYGCMVSAFGAQQISVARASDSAVLATIPFDVPLVPLVSSVTAAPPMYSQALVFTVKGSNLDGDRIDLDATGCGDVTLSTAAPYVSSANVAYYTCTVTQVGAQRATVAQASDGAVLGTVDFAVPVPQVTLNVSNGVAAGGGVVAGNLVVTLAPEEAPITVNNFLAYVNAGFYDGTIFHRYVPGFVLQGGGFAAALDPALPVPALKPTSAPIALEVGRGLSNLRLTVAMARTSVLNSATSQFFINLVDNVFLDTAGGGYAVFGEITEGAALVDVLPTAPCASYPALLGRGECLPFPNLTVLSARQTR